MRINKNELKEHNELELILYRDNNFEILSIPNNSDKKIICFMLKVFDNFNEFYMTGICKIYRISMIIPEYIEIDNDSLKLSKNEINKLISILKSTNSGTVFDIFNHNERSIWERLIFEQNREHKFLDNIKWTDLPKDLPIPDYTLLPTRD